MRKLVSDGYFIENIWRKYPSEMGTGKNGEVKKKDEKD